MDEFEVFFTFYGLILGLAAAEILSSLGGLARDGSLRLMRPQAALIAFLTFLLICATWIDAWSLRASFSLDLRSLWAPIGAATAYYLAAVVVLPRKSADWENMDAYFAEHKGFVVVALLAAEIFATVMYLPRWAGRLETEPMAVWLFSVPLTLAIFGAFAAMFFAKGQRANISAIVTQIVIFTVPYWSFGVSSTAIRQAFGYSAA